MDTDLHSFGQLLGSIDKDPIIRRQPLLNRDVIALRNPEFYRLNGIPLNLLLPVDRGSGRSTLDRDRGDNEHVLLGFERQPRVNELIGE